MKHFHQARGFSLLEVLISMAMITTSILLICSSLITGQKSVHRSRSRFAFDEQIESIAQQKLNQMKDSDSQANGEENIEGTDCRWVIRSEGGLITISIQGENRKEKLQKQLSVCKSAWLSGMGEKNE